MKNKIHYNLTKILTPIAFAMTISLCAAVEQTDVRVTPGDIKDNRSTGSFGGLEIHMKVLGDALSNAKAMRYEIKNAEDERGNNLMNVSESKNEFEEIEQFGHQSNSITIKLKNPARQALSIKEISGELEIFVPKMDPDSVVSVNDFLIQTGNPIASPSLKAGNMAVTVWNKAQYDAHQAEEAKKNSNENGNSSKAVPQQLEEDFSKMFGGMLGGGMSENSIAIQVIDPHSRLVKFEVEDANGKTIQSGSTMIMGDTRIIDFQHKLPETARLKLYLITPKSLIKAPFKLSNVPLP